jgi:hypothetical protein
MNKLGTIVCLTLMFVINLLAIVATLYKDNPECKEERKEQ